MWETARAVLIYQVDGRQAVDDAEHELCVADVVVRRPDAESVHQHLVERAGAQWVRQLAEVVLQQHCGTTQQTTTQSLTSDFVPPLPPRCATNDGLGQNWVE